MDQSCWRAEFKQIPVFHRNTSAQTTAVIEPAVDPGDPVLGSPRHEISQLDAEGSFKILMVDFCWFTRMATKKKEDHFFFAPLFLLASYYTTSHEMGPRSSLRISIVSAVGQSIQLKHFHMFSCMYHWLFAHGKP